MAHVLLLEPNIVLARVYTQALTHAGHSVTHVTGAQSAIHAADADLPGLVIVELQLPEHSGVEFLHEFRSYSEWLRIPVVVNTSMLSAYTPIATAALQRDLGVCDVLYKPRTTLQDLVRVVRQRTVTA